MSFVSPRALSQLEPIPGMTPDPRESTFRIIEDVLRTFPPLMTWIKTWRSREGQPGEMSMVATGQMPLIGLSPVPNPNQIWGVDETKVNFGVSVQVFVPGTYVGDQTAIWWAIEEAIRDDRIYRGQKLRDYLCTGVTLDDGSTRSIVNLRPRMPAIFPFDLTRVNDSTSVTYQMGVGDIVCFFSRPK